jgi:hypothetical protein
MFIDDARFQQLWCGEERYYLLADHEDLPHVKSLTGDSMLHVVKESGGKYLLSNQAYSPIDYRSGL